MKYNKKVVRALIYAMRFTDKDMIPDYKAISRLTHNGLHFATWDRRFQILPDQINDDSRYKTLIIPRGNLWTLVAILDIKESQLYIMMTEQNLKSRRQEVEKNHYSPHYVYTLLHANEGLKPKSEQLELIPDLDDNQKEQREKDFKKILGEWVNEVDQVLISSFSYDHGDIIAGSLNLFNDNYQLVDSVDLSEQILHPIDYNIVRPNLEVTQQPQEPLVKLRKKTRSQELEEKKSNN